MTTTVAEACERDVIVATADTTVAAAAKIMRHNHVGSVVIVDHVNGGLGMPVGIVTDRDIVVEVVATELDATVITVGDIMRDELITVRADHSVLDAVQLMRFKGVRRLPVVNRDGRLIGLVSLDDLLEIVTEPLVEISRLFGREQSHEAAHRR